MTSERNKRVEEEEEGSTNRWARRRTRPREQARGGSRCPCVVKEGKWRMWRRLVGLLRETEERSTVSHENPNEVQPPTKWSTQHLHTRSLWETSGVKDRSFPVESEELILQIWTEVVAESFLNRQHKKHSPCWKLVVCQLVFPRLFKIRFITGGYSSTGPRTPRQPLKEAAVDTPSQRGNKDAGSVLESHVGIPSVCLENRRLHQGL